MKTFENTEVKSTINHSKNEKLRVAKLITIPILIIGYLLLPKQSVIEWIRWLIFFLILALMAIYWDFGLKFSSEFEKSIKKIDFIMLNLALIVSFIMLLSILIINLDVIPNSLLLLKTNTFVSIGFLLFLFGQTGAYITRFGYLKASWSGTSSSTQGEIKMDGPYRYFRHPIYFFSSIMFVGTAMAFSTWWMILCAIIIMIIYILLGFRDEEQLKFRVEYTQYMSKTPHFLIQWLWWKRGDN